jgi:hypothetical protein
MDGWTAIGDLVTTDLPAKLAWRDGRLSGSPEALQLIDDYVAEHETVGVTPTGPFIRSDKHHELSAFVMVGKVVRQIDWTGETPVPPVPVLPDGAIP